MYKILVFFVAISLSVFANENYVISGKVINENSEPAPSATVMLKSSKDSSVVTGTYSDSNGDFIINASSGSYFIEVTYISYEKYSSEVFSLNGDIDLDVIEIIPASFMTEDVIVQAEREMMEFKLDKRVINIDKDPRNKGKNASEILDNIPSVTVDVEGNISLRGSEGVRILVDGKPSTLISNDPEALRQLMGDMIDKIEVITNPSAKYDAQGDAGIINIVLKKEDRRGVNAGMELNTGTPDNHGISANANYRYDFFNFFGSFGLSWRKNPGEIYSYQQYLDNPSVAFTETNRDQVRGGFGSNIRIGSDIFLNQNNIITFAGMYRFGDRSNQSDIIYNDYDLQKILTGTQYRYDDESESKNDIEFDLGYKLQFDDEDHVLLADAKFMQDRDVEESEILHMNNNNTGIDVNQLSYNLEFEREQLYQLDYTYPFGKEGKIEAGGKADLRKIDNDYWVKELDETGWEFLGDYNNNFLYFENIYAAYFTAGNKYERFGWQTGLRAEYSDITTELLKTDYYNRRDYLDLFPTVHLSYKLNESNSLQASYSRRIRRPYFRMLMPFSSFSDSRNIWSGNPDLDPVYTDSYEAGVIFNGIKSSLLTSVYYRNSRGLMQRVTRVDEDGITRISPFNIGTEDAYGIEGNFSYDPFEWWTLSNNVNFYRSIISGNENVYDLSSDAWTWNNRLTSKIKLIYNIDFQLNFNYYAPREVPQGDIEEIWYVDFGISKDFLNNKMTVILSGNDIFDTRRRRMMTYGDDFIFEQNYNWHSGYFTLSFSYRFNQAKKKSSPLPSGDGGGDM
jgi:outer membrane receptor protein involved in Fe transport